MRELKIEEAKKRLIDMMDELNKICEENGIDVSASGGEEGPSVSRERSHHACKGYFSCTGIGCYRNVHAGFSACFGTGIRNAFHRCRTFLLSDERCHRDTSRTPREEDELLLVRI